ncbi:hypothetical protein B0J18DRAFT_293411 [Chaetomium sp. MPI-SDFR-AT-0129]|nr:hypothetical protein B0J18DRAFT_293411 [Chaetomium sp. MPI-SDFR-AT-0129]
MKFNNVLATAATLAPLGVSAGPTPKASKMKEMMALKTKQWAEAREQGLFGGSALYSKVTSATTCTNGVANGYHCNNVDLHGFLSHEDLGSQEQAGNDVWGWTSPDGREFGLVGQADGTAFVEINKDDGSLRYIGRLNTQTTASSWRDVKVIGDHAYIGSEAADHGVQIFDLTRLLQESRQATVNATAWQPRVFSTQNDLTALFTGADGLGSTHNIVSHAASNTIYAVGGESGANARDTPCAAGMYIIDVSDPANPTSPGCIPQDGYVHDSQCVTYNGPSDKYNGRQVCFNYNEDTLTIMDVTDGQNPEIISRTPYDGAAYTHQGWLTDDTMKYLLLDDEQDEMRGTDPNADGHTTTYIFDISDLTNPVNTGYYKSPAKSIDHNQYVLNGLTYQANYGSGLRVVDISGVHEDPTGGNFEETGFFDCHPEDDDVNGEVKFLGTWSVYPYFKSGYILLNSIERGIFSLKYTGREAKFNN